jgi:protoheme ferro-lyase
MRWDLKDELRVTRNEIKQLEKELSDFEIKAASEKIVRQYGDNPVFLKAMVSHLNDQQEPSTVDREVR